MASPSSALPLFLLLALFQPEAARAALPSRWAHTLALLSSPSTSSPSEHSLLISGGKLSSTGQTYTSSPTTGSSVRLSLDTPFRLADAAELAEELANAGPPYAWATVEPLRDDSGLALSLGGDGSPGTAVQTGHDSAWLYSSAAGWSQQASEWAAQPVRREGAASCTLGNTSYFTAGSRADGSVTADLSTYAYTPTGGFIALSATLPAGLLQPNLHCLNNGTLLLVGGFNVDTLALAPLSTAYALDTTDTTNDWQSVSLGGATPPGRRAALGVTFGSGSGLFLAGGGTGQNGLERPLDDAFVLDFERAEWQAVAPTGIAPGARLGAQGVAIGNSQILSFGGYETNSAADGNLYLYDLATNAYLDTFMPPSAWSAAASSGGAQVAVPTLADTIPAYAIATQTTVIVYTELQTAQTVLPIVVTDPNGIETTSSVTSAVATATVTASALATVYEVTLSSGATSTVYPAALASGSLAAEISSSRARPVGEKSWDPATYTGIVPGYATLTTSQSAGSRPTGGTATGDSDSSVEASGAAGNGAMSSSRKAAIGVGSTFGFLALAALALGALVVIRKRRRVGPDDEDEKTGLAGGQPRRWAGQSGTWSSAAFGGAAGATWNDFTGRERKRVRLYGRLSEKLAILGGGGITAGAVPGSLGQGGPSAGQSGRRWGMLDDEDTRRFETYPPPFDRSSSQSDSLGGKGDPIGGQETDPFGDDMANRAGMGVFDRSLSFAPVPESDEADGDIAYGRLHDDDNESDPFADEASPSFATVPAAGIKRSTATNNFYPNAYSSIDYSTTPESSNHSASSHRSHGGPRSRPPPSASTTFHSQPSAMPSRSNSNSGWRKVLGLNLRTKSPPPSSDLTDLPPSVRVMGSRMRELRDPTTPPVLGFDEDLEKGEWAGLPRKSFGQLGRGQDASLSSLTSAHTATSDQFERFNHLDIVQRNRTTSGSTATPEASPELESSPSAPAFCFPPALPSSAFEPLRNPFEDDASEEDLIALSPSAAGNGAATFVRPPARPTGARPLSSSGPSARSARASPSLSTPASAEMAAVSSSGVSSTRSATETPGSLSPISIDSLSPNPSYSTSTPVAPPPIRRSVRDTIAAFEQHSTTATTTEPLLITKKLAPARSKKTSYTTVARPTLTLANPDKTPRKPSD